MQTQQPKRLSPQLGVELSTTSGHSPSDELIIVPTKVINKDNVDAFEADLKAKINGSTGTVTVLEL